MTPKLFRLCKVYYKNIYDEDVDTGKFRPYPVDSDLFESKDIDKIADWYKKYLGHDVVFIYKIEDFRTGEIIEINQ